MLVWGIKNLSALVAGSCAKSTTAVHGPPSSTGTHGHPIRSEKNGSHLCGGELSPLIRILLWAANTHPNKKSDAE